MSVSAVLSGKVGDVSHAIGKKKFYPITSMRKKILLIGMSNMNREIKFRAWFEKSSQICEVWAINWHNKTVNIAPEGINPSIAFLGDVSLEDVILLQFTGLHDKNGREIYEGDVVNVIYGVESRNIDGGIEKQVAIPCVFSFGLMGGSSWIPNWGNLIMRPLMTQKQFKAATHKLHSQFNPYGNSWELGKIGNIYEHPDLLK